MAALPDVEFLAPAPSSDGRAYAVNAPASLPLTAALTHKMPPLPPSDDRKHAANAPVPSL